jgi:hypothetical protein
MRSLREHRRRGRQTRGLAVRPRRWARCSCPSGEPLPGVAPTFRARARPPLQTSASLPRYLRRGADPTRLRTSPGNSIIRGRSSASSATRLESGASWTIRLWKKSGRRAASPSAIDPPNEFAATWAGARSRASISAAKSSSSSRRDPCPSGLSLREWPRRSYVSTRKDLARCGTTSCQPLWSTHEP